MRSAAARRGRQPRARVARPARMLSAVPVCIVRRSRVLRGPHEEKRGCPVLFHNRIESNGAAGNPGGDEILRRRNRGTERQRHRVAAASESARGG